MAQQAGPPSPRRITIDPAAVEVEVEVENVLLTHPTAAHVAIYG